MRGRMHGSAQKLQAGADCVNGCVDKESSQTEDMEKGIWERSAMTGK